MLDPDLAMTLVNACFFSPEPDYCVLANDNLQVLLILYVGEVGRSDSTCVLLAILRCIPKLVDALCGSFFILDVDRFSILGIKRIFFHRTQHESIELVVLWSLRLNPVLYEGSQVAGFTHKVVLLWRGLLGVSASFLLSLSAVVLFPVELALTIKAPESRLLVVLLRLIFKIETLRVFGVECLLIL